MWERDGSYPWSWRSARWLINDRCKQKPISSTSPSQPPIDQEREEPLVRDSDPHGFHSFRAYIDREITKDPYGVLFGKRLESPPSANNSSWTSFSWIFEPKVRKADTAVDHPTQEPLASDQAPTAKKQAPSTGSPTPTPNKTSIPRNSETEAADEYEYDPITMRKVPKMKSNAESTPNQPFLKSLFSEHGVDIPVKAYKPHRVFGYGPKSTSETASQGEVSDSPKTQFTSSRKSEFSSLMAQSKGNNIDTTAQYTDILPKQEIEVVTEEPAETRPRKSPEPDDSTPLFSGTTYEARSLPSDALPSSTSDWLSREGFRTAEQATSKEKEVDDAAIEIQNETIQSKLDPALDRMSTPVAENATKSDSARLEPSIDRHVANISGENHGRLKATRNADLQEPTSEDDIDLRASDVRAATKSARVSKQQLETSKQKTRSRLESDFTKHQSGDSEAHDLTAKNITRTAGQISKSLTNIWNHIKDYPSGVVARTMQSMNTFNNDYRKYVKPSNNSDLTEKLIFKDENLSKTPSIYRSATTTNGSKPVPTLSNVQKEENERSSRTERLRAAAEEVKAANEVSNAQLSQLAAEIKVIYEEECGPIPQKPTLSVGESGDTPSKPEILVESSDNRAMEDTRLERDVQKVQAQLQTIQSGLQDMELAYEKSAKLRTVIDGTKELRRELHEAGMALRAIESGRPQTVWNTPTASSTNFGKKRMELTDRRAELKKADKDNDEKMQPSANEIEPSTQTPSGSPKEGVPHEVPAPVFTPPESPVWNDEQPPPIESLKEKPLESTYVVLAQDRSTGKIEMSPLNNVPISSDTSISPILVLSKLHRASDYLAHFERLEKAGYDLYTGSRNMLIFRKRQAASSKSSTSTPSTSSITDEVSLSKQAATVLDEIPVEVDPSPGPAAPTAPPSNPSKQPDQAVLKSRVRRQEKVFSGTMRPGEESAKENENEESFTPNTLKGTLWEKCTRGVKRVILTAVALGGAAYTIGFVAEGIGAQTQIQNGIDDGHAQGPRKRIVMTGQRPGIYSTESSR
jgi:hypothetical protein